MRYVSIDIETSGLDPELHQILQFGAVVDDGRPIEELPRFCEIVKWERISGQPTALAMNASIIARMDEGIRPNELGPKFRDFLIKNGFEAKRDYVIVTAAGKNFGSFDRQFLLKHDGFKKAVWFKSRCLDPGPMYARADDDEVPGLEECMKRAGIEGSVSHDALDDAMNVVKCIRKGFR